MGQLRPKGTKAESSPRTGSICEWIGKALLQGTGASLLVALCGLPASAQTILQQNFDSSSSVPAYVSATPDSGQFNIIGGSGGVSVSLMDIGFDAGNSLVWNRLGGTGAGVVARTTDMAAQPGAVIVQFLFTPGFFSAAASGVVTFQVGSNFTTAASAELSQNAAASISVDLRPSAGPAGGDWWGWGGSAQAFAGFQGSGFPRVTWVVNNRTSSVTYTNPNNDLVTLESKKTDLWVGDSGLAVQVFQGVGVANGAVPLTDFKMIVNGGSALYAIDNLTITQMGSFFEPKIVLGRPSLQPGHVTIQATGTVSTSWSVLRASSILGPWTTNLNALILNSSGAGQYQDNSPLAGSAFYQTTRP